MSRLIRHDAKGPAIIDTGRGLIEICQCGLSENKPFCDGSHSKTKGEEDHVLYVYDAQRNRVAVPDMFPPPTRKYEPPP